ncbi:HtaA domain-containing protein [Phenylobacterium soli]|uniref:Htaa domain-containing protein n=1 Tax=Phenylobacterium soli TaxID=2170551 RepID=A0A328AI75_9CAUL|nr:HtaA domain-containing protein [Phenylobacterium soli]RAK54217.1 hypothetical protein DJ017_06615 [Phenylobacterium soli]
MTDQRQPAADAPIAALEWGVKQSFCNYVRMAGGSIETAAGAEAVEGGFRFPAAPGEGRFQGEVRFDAHGGMLAVRLADPAVEIGPGRAVLSIADLSAGGRRVEIATLDLAAASTEADGARLIPAALTLDGSFVLGDHYPPGTALDPLRLAPVRLAPDRAR